MDIVSNVIRAIAAWLDWQNKRHDNLNSSKIQNNKEAKINSQVKEDAEKAVEKATKGDLDELRKMASE